MEPLMRWWLPKQSVIGATFELEKLHARWERVTAAYDHYKSVDSWLDEPRRGGGGSCPLMQRSDTPRHQIRRESKSLPL
jgi:hypothetical protein